MLQLENAKGEKLLAMSRSACESLNRQQLSDLTAYNKIVASPIPSIEKYGGGSVRCMIAEVN
jgi:hypothetical protein